MNFHRKGLRFFQLYLLAWLVLALASALPLPPAQRLVGQIQRALWLQTDPAALDVAPVAQRFSPAEWTGASYDSGLYNCVPASFAMALQYLAQEHAVPGARVDYPTLRRLMRQATPDAAAGLHVQDAAALTPDLTGGRLLAEVRVIDQIQFPTRAERLAQLESSLRAGFPVIANTNDWSLLAGRWPGTQAHSLVVTQIDQDRVHYLDPWDGGHYALSHAEFDAAWGYVPQPGVAAYVTVFFRLAPPAEPAAALLPDTGAAESAGSTAYPAPVAPARPADPRPGPPPAPAGQIAYVKDGSLWLADLTTGRSALLVSDRDLRRPAWSPDGRYLTYEARRGEVTSLFLYDTARASARLLAGNACCAAWSPQIGQVAFIAGGTRLETLALGTGERQVLLPDLGAAGEAWVTGNLAYARDARHLYLPLEVAGSLAGTPAPTYRGVFLVDLPRQVMEPFLPAPGDRYCFQDPAPPPDGRVLALTLLGTPDCGDWHPGTVTLLLIFPNGSRLELPAAGAPSWSPDGRRLAVVAYDPVRAAGGSLAGLQPWGLALYDPARDELRRLVPGASQPAWRPE